MSVPGPPRAASAARRRIRPAAEAFRAPRLVLGLGNDLMGDDGVGPELVRALGEDPRLPPDVEVSCGGTDLLGCLPLLRGRTRIVLVDAAEGARAGEVIELDAWGEAASAPAGEAPGAGGAHSLSVPASLAVLRCAEPELAATELRLVALTVQSVAAGAGLSPELRRRVPALVDHVLRTLEAPPSGAHAWQCPEAGPSPRQ